MNVDKEILKSANFDLSPPIAIAKYDESIRQFNAAYEPMFDMAYASLRSMLPGDADVLIVGAGTGMEICAFGRRCPGWKFTGVDPSTEMLSIAKKKIAENKLSCQVSLFTGYAHDLPGSKLFDAATCILVMHFLPDDDSKLELLKSIGSHLKKGSPLILVDGFGDRSTAGFDRTLLAWKEFVKTQGVDPVFVEDGFRGILNRLHFVSDARITELLDEAGFEHPTRFFMGFLYGGWVVIKK